MEITERQEEILNRIVKDYINLAEPISSEFLEKKYNLGISPATIRNEMQRLTETGFLNQPHTSAGRIPTAKGYRFVVDKLFEEGFSDFSDKRLIKEFERIEKEFDDYFKFSQEITKVLASFSSDLALTYLLGEDLVWREGWDDVFLEPEFKSSNYLKNFLDIIYKFEENIDKFELENSKITVFIGGENPIKNAKDFSLLVCQSKFPKDKRGTLALLGPKRMPYKKNISLLNSVLNLLEKI